MKLQIAFDMTDLEKALIIAQDVQDYADILEVGSLLIFKHGELAVKKFKEKFSQKTILADAKIVDRSKDAVTIFAQAGADWITVMAGTNKNVIHNACIVAHQMGKKIMLDLLDAASVGQIALEAASFGVDALVFHHPIDEEERLVFNDTLEMVKGNTKLPLFISAEPSHETIKN